MKKTNSQPKNEGAETKMPQRKYVPTVSRVLENGQLVELVYQPDKKQTALVVGDDTGWVGTKKYVTPSKETLVPYTPKNNLIRHKVILFASEPSEYGTEAELVADIRSYIERYLDVTSDYLDIAAYYVLFTWIYDKFNELPYLRSRGDFGSGKTRFLLTIGSICYKPIFASGASTISPIFHMLDAFGGTLLIDEADFRVSDEKAEIVKILNNGNVRGFPVLRSEQSPTNEFNPRAFDVYSPKIIATRSNFEDPALESRFITQDMHGASLRSDIPINLPARHSAEALALRNKLLLFRFRNYKKVVNLDGSVNRNIEPRLAQIFNPLLSVINDVVVRNDLEKRIADMDQEMKAERGVSVERRVLETIQHLQREEKSHVISVSKVHSMFNERYSKAYQASISPKWIGTVIRKRLLMNTTKRKGVYILDPNSVAKLPALYRRYGVR